MARIFGNSPRFLRQKRTVITKVPDGGLMDETTEQKLQDGHLSHGKSKITIASDISSVTHYPWHFSDLPSQYLMNPQDPQAKNESVREQKFNSLY